MARPLEYCYDNSTIRQTLPGATEISQMLMTNFSVAEAISSYFFE